MMNRRSPVDYPLLPLHHFAFAVVVVGDQCARSRSVAVARWVCQFVAAVWLSSVVAASWVAVVASCDTLKYTMVFF